MRDKLDMLIAESMAIEAEDAQQAGTVGFIARVLTQATMPHKAQSDNEFTRQNGHFTATKNLRKSLKSVYVVNNRAVIHSGLLGLFRRD